MLSSYSYLVDFLLVISIVSQLKLRCTSCSMLRSSTILILLIFMSPVLRVVCPAYGAEGDRGEPPAKDAEALLPAHQRLIYAHF